MFAYTNNLDYIVKIEIKVSIFVVSVLVLLFNGVSLIALLRTHHTPKTARFLSAALLVFDFLSTLMYTIRKVVEDPRYNLMFHMMAMACSYSAYINIAIMSLERLVLFEWPIFYLRRVRFCWVKAVCVTTWSMYLGVYTIHTVQCYVNVDVESQHTLVCFENVIIRHALVIFTFTTVVSCITLSRILMIIQKQREKNIGVKSSLRQHKSTACVLFCCGNYLVTTVSCMLLAFVVTQNHMRRIVIDIVLTVNCFVDTCVYVWWYKECRLKLIQFFSKIYPGLERRVEAMRINIFDIMTYNHESTS